MAYPFVESWTSSTALNSSPPQGVADSFLGDTQSLIPTSLSIGFRSSSSIIVVIAASTSCCDSNTLLVKKFQSFQAVHFRFHCSQSDPNFSHPPFSSSLYLQSQNDEVLGRFRFLQERAFLGTKTPNISSATFQCLEDHDSRRWLLSSTTTVEYSLSSSSPTLSSGLSSPSSRLELFLFLLLRFFISDSRSLLLCSFTASCNSTWPSSATKRNEIHIHTHKHVHKFVAILYKVHTRWVSKTMASVTSSRRLLTLSFFFFFFFFFKFWIFFKEVTQLTARDN